MKRKSVPKFTNLTRRLAFTGTGLGTICPSWSHAPGDRQQRKEQRVWGQWYRQERKWRWRTELESPQNLGGGDVS